MVRHGVVPVVLCLVLSLGSNKVCRATAKDALEVTAAQLQALAGEYTDPIEPDTPLSFYVDHGKLIEESDRQVPTELTPVSANEFGRAGVKEKIDFTLDANGRSASLTLSTTSGSHLPPNRRACASRLSRLSAHRSDDPHARRGQAACGDSEAGGHCGAAADPDAAHALWSGWNHPRSFFAQRPELARDGYIYVAEDIRGRYKSEGKFVMSRPLADHHDPKAIDESTDAYDTVEWLIKNVPGQQRPRRRGGHKLSGLSGDDGGHRSASGGEGDFAAGADDRCVDGRRFLSQRRLPPDLRIRLRAWGWSRTRSGLEVGYGKDKDGKPRDGFDYFLERGNFARGREEIGLEECCPPGSSSWTIRHTTRCGRRAAWSTT